MKKSNILIIPLALILFACSKDEITENRDFKIEELEPVVNFTLNNEEKIVSPGKFGCSWSHDDTYYNDDYTTDIAELSNYGISSGITSEDNKYQFQICINKWIDTAHFETSELIWFMRPVKPEYFFDMFYIGNRRFSIEGNNLQKSDEVSIHYRIDDDLYHSHWTGNMSNKPEYNELQPQGYFKINRSQNFSNDSAFVEVNFTVRLYKNTLEYIDLENGYFKSYFYRKPEL